MNILMKLQDYKAMKNQVDAMKAQLDAMKAEIMEYIDSSEKTVIDEKGKKTYTCGQYVATVLTKTRTDIDKKRLEIDFPEIAKEYQKSTTYPELRVK